MGDRVRFRKPVKFMVLTFNLENAVGRLKAPTGLLLAYCAWTFMTQLRFPG